MKVSVIVPYEGYYNYLQDCLESIQDQKNVELETLLVGNQETDDFKKSKSFRRLFNCCGQ